MAITIESIPLSCLAIDRLFSTIQQQSIRSLALTAAEASEGVTTLTLALAKRLAAAKISTLLVDFDLSSASLSHYFQREFIQSGDLEAALQKNIIQTDIAHLSFLPAPRIGSKLITLRDKNFIANQIQKLQQQYQIILFDTSAVNSEQDQVIPSETVCGATDSCLMVVLTGKTSRMSIEFAVKKIHHAGGKLIGSVFNDQYNPPLRDELIEFCQKISSRFPKSAKRLENYFRQATWLKLEKN